jgi:cell division transport system ATP-binding protein
LLAAIERPTSGSIVVNGQNLAALRRSAIPYLRRNFGLIFQDQKLLFDRCVLDNVMLPLAIVGLPAKEAVRRARAAIDKVGLRDREKALPIALSGGEQQRLAIARAVVNRPAILLADEPTANLDAESASDILEIFRAFHQVGVTTVIATHDPQWMSRLSPRILRLEKGQIQGDQNKTTPEGVPA